MVTANELILQRAYRKYKNWDVEVYGDFIKANPDIFLDWRPYTYEQFMLKAFDCDDDFFMEKFDTWYDESKIEYRESITSNIHNGNLRDGE